MALLSSEIARLIHHHLLKEGCVKAANSFISECPHLKGLKPVEDKQTAPYKLPRLIGPSLQDLLEEYFETKDCIIDELEEAKCENYKVQNCLVTLTKTLLQSIKLHSCVVPKRPTCHASVNTDFKTFYSVSVNTETTSCLTTCDVSTNTEEEAKVLPCEEDSQFDSEMSPDSRNFLDFSVMYDRLLEDSALHEKIAETINKNISRDDFNLSASSKSPDQANSISEASCDLSSVIKSIVAETQADPVINTILKDCLGVDIEDITPVNTPSGVAEEEKNSPEIQTNLPIEGAYSAPVNELAQLSTNLAMGSLNSYTIVTAPNGQVSLQPTVLAALPSLNLGMSLINPIPVAPNPPILPRRPVAIAPKPQISAQVDSAVNDALSGFPQEFTVQPVNSKSPSIRLQTVPVVNETKAVKSKPNRIMKVTHPLKKIANATRNQAKKSKGNVSSTPANSNHTNSFTPALTSLLALVTSDINALSSVDKEATAAPQEATKNAVEKQHRLEDQNDGGSCISQSSSGSKKDVSISGSDKPLPASPASAKKRRSHIRVLDFGVSPGSKANLKKTSGPVVGSKTKTQKSDKAWDADLRFLTGCPPSVPECDVFATPKGKAKRAKKVESSPPPTVGGAGCKELEVDDSPAPDMLTPCEASTPAVQRLDSGPPTFVPSVSAISCNSPFSEIAQTPMKNVDNSVQEESSARISGSIGSNVQLTQPKELAQMIDGINDLFTPQKVDDTTSSVFSWIGEIPRTPQINTEITSSSSPFLVSLTKGFQFLPAAESPTLPVPATPSIAGEYAGGSNSIDTPCANFYQFPQTPRLEALRQELLSSPCQSLSSTMISPTQVVLGRSTPYFVPSGERAKGPLPNQNATPEHVLETQEQLAKRRNSTEMEPLQLEESNDASDFATMLLSKAAAESTSSLEATAKVTVPTPMKSDTSLENALISECQRLDDPVTTNAGPSNQLPLDRTPSNSAPSNSVTTPLSNTKLQEKFLNLFGEDSSFDTGALNKSSEDSLPSPEQEEPALTSIQQPTTPKSSRKPRRKRPLDEEQDTCARLQDYGKSPLFQQKTKRHTTSLSSSQEEEATAEGYENVIQELLLMATASIDDSESSKKQQKQRRSKCNTTETQSRVKKVNQMNTSLPEAERKKKGALRIRHSLPNSATKSVLKSCEKLKKIPSPLRGSPRLFKSRLPPYHRKCISYKQTLNGKKRSQLINVTSPPTQQVANEETVIDEQISQTLQQVSNLTEQVKLVEEAIQLNNSSQVAVVSSPCKKSVDVVVEDIDPKSDSTSTHQDDQCNTVSRLPSQPEFNRDVSVSLASELVQPSSDAYSQVDQNKYQTTPCLSEDNDSRKPSDEPTALQSADPQEMKTQKKTENESSKSTMQNYIKLMNFNDTVMHNGPTVSTHPDRSQSNKLRFPVILTKFLSRAQKRLRTEKIDVFSQ